MQLYYIIFHTWQDKNPRAIQPTTLSVLTLGYQTLRQVKTIQAINS